MSCIGGGWLEGKDNVRCVKVRSISLSTYVRFCADAIDAVFLRLLQCKNGNQNVCSFAPLPHQSAQAFKSINLTKIDQVSGLGSTIYPKKKKKQFKYGDAGEVSL